MVAQTPSDGYKAICKRRHQSKRAALPWTHKVSPKLVLEKMYRLGQSSLREWGCLETAMRALLPPPHSLQCGIAQRPNSNWIIWEPDLPMERWSPSLHWSTHISRGALQLDIPNAIEVLERESPQAVFLEIVDVGVRRNTDFKGVFERRRSSDGFSSHYTAVNCVECARVSM